MDASCVVLLYDELPAFSLRRRGGWFRRSAEIPLLLVRLKRIVRARGCGFCAPGWHTISTLRSAFHKASRPASPSAPTATTDRWPDNGASKKRLPLAGFPSDAIRRDYKVHRRSRARLQSRALRRQLPSGADRLRPEDR